jgi:predicted metal-dependent hydrolase
MKLWFWRVVRRRIRGKRKRKTPARNKKHFALHKEMARDSVHTRLAHFNEHYKLPVGRVAIRNQKTRWGSCSKLGNLNFNYRLALIHPELADYVVVHELCHIKEFNHSQKFWDMVAEKVPDHRIHRAELKKVFHLASA